MIQKARKVAEYLKQLDDVKDVWLFGSYVSDEFMHYSDVDLAVVVVDDAELAYVDLMEHLGRLRIGLDFEIHLYRESEFNLLLSNSSSFVAREIVGKGVHLT